ncbi:type VII secretion system-associated protein [Amycolatopsis sp. cg5]|uniref:type VII secretion system-associated protein n=1 Tax=Amycolatopsis sp. cg5 TaxID=3238802 RepID=UPI003526251A
MSEPAADLANPNESGGRLILLFDPAFEPDQQDEVPSHVVLGAWLLNEAGVPSRFQPNPHYRPSTPDSPLDPVDAVLRALVRGEDVADQLPVVLRDSVLGIAAHADGTAVIRPAPDGVPSVQVATSYGHRAAVGDVGWLDVTLGQVAGALPAEGVDVLLNAGSPASMRLTASAVRAAAET